MELEITEEDTVVSHLFDWCGNSNQHDKCKRAYRRFLMDPKSNKPVYLKEVVKCSCKKRGCLCYTKPADRPKPAKKAAKRRRKK